MHGVHKHGRGWRGTISVSTATYPTEEQAAAAIADLRAGLVQLRGSGRVCVGRADALTGWFWGGTTAAQMGIMSTLRSYRSGWR
jgi:hypothetical protein